MENDGNIIIPILGYIIALISPLIGLIYGAALVFLKKDVAEGNAVEQLLSGGSGNRQKSRICKIKTEV